MALYKNAAYLGQVNDAIFDQLSPPGTPATRSGIYRCEGCRKEVASNQGEPLPPQNHHQHVPSQGTIRWRLIVYAQHDPN